MLLKTCSDMCVKPISRFKRAYCRNNTNNFYDIIISGGGLIGQTMACALTKNPVFKNCTILLIESSPKKEYSTPQNYSNRVSSIAPSTKDLFVKLGMWKNITRYQVMSDMKIWGSFSNDYVHFTHDDNKPAYIIENDEIINSAVKENSSASNLNILYGKSIRNVKLNVDNNSGLHEIHIDDNLNFQSSLLIGADGPNSVIRKAMDINYISWKYHQFGIVATLNLSDDRDNTTAWQRFLPDGPVAILPLRSGLSSLVWSMTEKKAKDLMKIPDEVFVDALNDALHSDPEKNSVVSAVSDCSKSCLDLLKMRSNNLPLLPPFIKSVITGSRASFPLGFGHSSEYTKPGVVLIGDSAHKVHPLAGQGVNIGFRDIRCLEEKLAQGHMDGRELGHRLDLKHYETEAQRHNIPIMAAIDLFHRIYTSKADVVKALGNSCFHIANSVSPIKNIMKQLATN